MFTEQKLLDKSVAQKDFRIATRDHLRLEALLSQMRECMNDVDLRIIIEELKQFSEEYEIPHEDRVSYSGVFWSALLDRYVAPSPDELLQEQVRNMRSLIFERIEKGFVEEPIEVHKAFAEFKLERTLGAKEYIRRAIELATLWQKYCDLYNSADMLLKHFLLVVKVHFTLAGFFAGLRVAKSSWPPDRIRLNSEKFIELQMLQLREDDGYRVVWNSIHNNKKDLLVSFLSKKNTGID